MRMATSNLSKYQQIQKLKKDQILKNENILKLYNNNKNDENIIDLFYFTNKLLINKTIRQDASTEITKRVYEKLFINKLLVFCSNTHLHSELKKDKDLKNYLLEKINRTILDCILYTMNDYLVFTDYNLQTISTNLTKFLYKNYMYTIFTYSEKRNNLLE